MCGITGIISARPIEPELVRHMADAIAHRGPDDSGVWLNDERSVALGHRRLSIIDLSPLGHQPMESHEGRYVLAYNGEIYNFGEIRAELEQAGARAWRGHSDTEVLLEAIAAWGLEGALERAVGMFALALWDKKTRMLRLARDRFGEKPLYYGWVGGDFLFGSELKALRRHPRFDNPVSRVAVGLLVARNYIPAPLSIYERIYKLDPGCIVTVDETAPAAALSRAPRPGLRVDGVVVDRYWSYREVIADGLRNPIDDAEEAEQRVEEALAEAIRGQSMADVPVGAFLSGGIDSSLVVALYQKHSSRPIRTFSMGFHEAAYNEADYAKRVAAHLGTEHHERYVTSAEARDVIPSLPAMYDEPFADSSQIPTHLVSRFAREKVTVSLSGDGGDELFGGYNRYFLAGALWNRMSRIPGPLRAVLGRSLSRVPPRAWTAATGLLPGRRRPEHFGMKVQKVLGTMSRAHGIEDIYRIFLDEWTTQGSPVLGSGDVPGDWAFDLDAGGGAPDTVRMMYCDAISYLPDDILCKVDRASMAVSLESRVPFLDHRVAALAARIPLGMKIGGGQGKRILRKILYKHAPQALFERPKAGFGVPVGAWMRGPLNEWAEDLLAPRRIIDGGYFDNGRVQARWAEHKSGAADHSAALWSILMFQAWQAGQSSDEAGRLASAA